MALAGRSNAQRARRRSEALGAIEKNQPSRIDNDKTNNDNNDAHYNDDDDHDNDDNADDT